MPAVIPPLLSPYVSSAGQGSLTLVTSVLDATSNWLLLRYIYAALNGQELTDDQVLIGNNKHEGHENSKVVFVSILRAYEQWREMGKKVDTLHAFIFPFPPITVIGLSETAILRRGQGLDFPSLVSSKRLIYINGLTDPTPLPSTSVRHANVVNFNVGHLEDLANIVPRYTEQHPEGQEPSRTLLVMDGLDFLLASQPALTSLTLSRMIMMLRQHVQNTIITSSADYPLLHNSSPGSTPLESEHRAFVTTLAHQSWTVVQLRSLGTGAAKDISGVLRVSAGGAYEDAEAAKAELEEGEWLYQVKGDGSVKVWGRGE